MVHSPLTPPPPPEGGSATVRQSTPAILLSVSALLSLFTKTAIRVSKKLRPQQKLHNQKDNNHYFEASVVVGAVKPPGTPRTPLAHRRKELFTNMSNKAIKLVHGRKKADVGAGEEDAEENFGDGGVWQRAILMGDKCQPLDFSGAIYYDETGRKLDHLPLRSPRASPMPGFLGRRDCYAVASQPQL